MKKSLFVLVLIFTWFWSFSQTADMKLQPEHLIWYDHPAEAWKKAIPVGNGRIGAMVFGGVKTEHLQLNDDSMWPGDPDWDLPEGTEKDVEAIRQCLFNGDNRQADSLFVEKFSNKTIVRSHQTLGDLYIDLGFKKFSHYKRQLDLENAVVTVTYKSKMNKIRERVFASHPHEVLVVELVSEKKAGINGKIRMSRPEDDEVSTAEVVEENGMLYMRGEVTQRKGKFRSEPYPIDYGMKFETVVKVVFDDGTVRLGSDFLELRNVTRAVIYVVNNTSYYHKDYQKKNVEQLKKIEEDGFDKILAEHIKDYQSLYDRVSLAVESPDYRNIPTDQRIKKVKKGGIDPGLETLLFQFGRYLLISSSRPGTNPANLQGLWNRHIKAPWNADYHLNINLQMNYWPSNVTGLSELNMPLFDFTDRLLENGKEVAEKNFGCRGSFAPHATDLWAPAWLRAPTAYWGCSMGAPGWMMQHYWDYFAFTRDTAFLKARAYPAMRQVAQFYSDWLITDPRDSTLISAPSTSPENRFINEKGDEVATCLGSAMDQQIIEEVFRNYMKTCEVLNKQDLLYKTIKRQYKQLRPGFVIGSDGRILEWDREYKETEPGHRHMSHLYGFYPGNVISSDSTPELFKAVKKTIDYRIEHGGAGPGWSRTWLINCDARLQQGAEAEKNIREFIKRSLYPDMFCAHPPFQIDGNFGFTAGVAEMLLQSFEEGVVRILPALPPVWKTGYVKGLKARGNVTVDIYWKDNKAVKVVMKPANDLKINMVVNGKTVPVELKKGKEFIWKV
jgi:alpha-L-fucosidase 2